ncbi:type II toxin-antitoxin system Phd/YefM family antitoxin [Marinomonas rhizomae]|uniref:Antitoxin n=1 Tax=Marinomonas rhizomae TaxID=491948 RepID=A0A366JDX4_9GAMM|nr:type II toxin-antitoxin system Phd/YefM family antitoxin [Marinomonas rhizomae]RBP85037.1 antitoxin YefM [Marinomonas rhizomae]RNF76151.1 type II toxin-antitoxin system Phd/YefM family antitoxin [Marinomonas rhizomae]
MDTISVNKFRDNLKSVVENVINQHEPVKITRRSGEDFVVISADDWEREQESLYVLQNKNLMQQISESITTHPSDNAQGRGYQPTNGELNEILDL